MKPLHDKERKKGDKTSVKPLTRMSRPIFINTVALHLHFSQKRNFWNFYKYITSSMQSQKLFLMNLFSEHYFPLTGPLSVNVSRAVELYNYDQAMLIIRIFHCQLCGVKVWGFYFNWMILYDLCCPIHYI